MILFIVLSILVIAVVAVTAYVIMGTWIAAIIGIVAATITIAVSVAVVRIVKHLTNKTKTNSQLPTTKVEGLWSKGQNPVTD